MEGENLSSELHICMFSQINTYKQYINLTKNFNQFYRIIKLGPIFEYYLKWEQFRKQKSRSVSYRPS